MNTIILMGSQSFFRKPFNFFKSDHCQFDFLRLLHAITMIEFEVNFSFESSDFPFGKIDIVE